MLARDLVLLIRLLRKVHERVRFIDLLILFRERGGIFIAALLQRIKFAVHFLQHLVICVKNSLTIIRRGLCLVEFCLNLAEAGHIVLECVIATSEDACDRVEPLDEALQWVHLRASNPPLNHREVVLIKNLDCGRELRRLVRMLGKQCSFALLGGNRKLLGLLEIGLRLCGILHGKRLRI